MRSLTPTHGNFTRPVSPVLLPAPGINPAIPPVRPLADLLKVLFAPQSTKGRAPP